MRPTSGQRSVEQPSCPSQRILDLREVANRHNREEKAVDSGFKILQGYGPALFLPSLCQARST